MHACCQRLCMNFFKNKCIINQTDHQAFSCKWQSLHVNQFHNLHIHRVLLVNVVLPAQLVLLAFQADLDLKDPRGLLERKADLWVLPQTCYIFISEPCLAPYGLITFHIRARKDLKALPVEMVFRDPWDFQARPDPSDPQERTVIRYKRKRSDRRFEERIEWIKDRETWAWNWWLRLNRVGLLDD